ncbi:hypothetical protein SAMN05421781_0600 [Marinococcus luteus]|uniref:Uncharacterized protein n=1 Tax=Marinococcus luteus TaxID=1122204 RepID=A0A1H2R781_9BACI|nr:hypothetical protein [Marinococcus luteus]SDW14529.1 hypothetical protein SAMN05421781_0600 [Marinococcus luteus]
MSSKKKSSKSNDNLTYAFMAAGSLIGGALPLLRKDTGKKTEKNVNQTAKKARKLSPEPLSQAIKSGQGMEKKAKGTVKTVKRAAKVSAAAFAMAKVPKKIKKKIYTLRYHVGEAVIHTGEKIQGPAYDPDRTAAESENSGEPSSSETEESAAETSESSGSSSGSEDAWEQEEEYEEEKFEGTKASTKKPAKKIKKLKKASNT